MKNQVRNYVKNDVRNNVKHDVGMTSDIVIGIDVIF